MESFYRSWLLVEENARGKKEKNVNLAVKCISHVKLATYTEDELGGD